MSQYYKDLVEDIKYLERLIKETTNQKCTVPSDIKELQDDLESLKLALRHASVLLEDKD